MVAIRSYVQRCLLVLGVLLSLAPSLVRAEEAKQSVLEQIGLDIAMAMDERDEEAFVELLNFERLAERIAATVVDTETERKGFVRGFVGNMTPQRFTRTVFASLNYTEGGSAKFMRAMDRAEDRRVLVRLNMGDSGFDYLEFVIEPDAAGRTRIVDWYSLSTGELLSTNVGALSRLLVDPNPSLLQSIFGIKSIDPATLKQLRYISDLRTRGDFRVAYFEMEKLPPELANSRIILTQRAGLASAFNDEERYRAMLEQLASRYSHEPATAFMLIDHYFYKQDYARCLDAIKQIEKRVGQDGMTSMLRANIYMLAKQWKEAAQSAREGIRIEPDFTGAHFTLVDALIGQEQFEEAVEQFKTLEAEFGYEFSSEAIEAEPTYAKFIKSKAYKNWRQ